MSDKTESSLNPANPMAFAMAWTAFGLGMTAQMLGAMSQAFADAGQGETRAESAANPDTAQTKSAPKETAKVFSFETAAKAKTSRLAQPAAAKQEDLKVISGIGPKLETLLNKLGIVTLAQIASWSAEDAVKIDQDLQLNGRVMRDDWRGQAKQMAEG